MYVITRLCGTGSIEPPLGWRAHLILIPTFRYIYPDVTSSSELQYITASAFAKIHPASSPYIFFTKLSPRQANVYAILYLLTFRKQSPLSIYKKNGFPPYLSMWLKYSLVRYGRRSPLYFSFAAFTKTRCSCIIIIFASTSASAVSDKAVFQPH